jgi:hypothetical protein
MPYAGVVRRCSLSSPKPVTPLDGPPQGVCWARGAFSPTNSRSCLAGAPCSLANTGTRTGQQLRRCKRVSQSGSSGNQSSSADLRPKTSSLLGNASLSRWHSRTIYPYGSSGLGSFSERPDGSGISAQSGYARARLSRRFRLQADSPA